MALIDPMFTFAPDDPGMYGARRASNSSRRTIGAVCSTFSDQPLKCSVRCSWRRWTGKNGPPPLWAVAARSMKAFMFRLQLRAGLAGTLLATSLADGAALNLASRGSSSPDPEANIAKTAARLEKLHTSAKTAPAARALNELSLKLNDCMMCSDGVVRTVLEESSAKATPCCRRLHRARSCGCMLRIRSNVRSDAGLTCSTPEMERGPEPFGVRAS